jgi:hypothetical protein
MKTLLLTLLVLATASTAQADTIHLKNGGTLEGVVLKKDQDGVVVLLKYATVIVTSFEIESVERVAPAVAPASSRLADWQICFQALAARPWGADLHILPAPIIDSGVLKNVPYVLHVSDDYQFSLYGDPDAPACIELGVSGVLFGREAARMECLELVAAFLRDPKDVAALRSLALKGGKTEREGLIFEIDQEPDSRGRETWWISVSNPGALDAARVSEKQLESLTTAEAPQTPRNPTQVEKTQGKGERQEVITPIQPEPEKKKHRKTYGGGGHTWGRHIRWHGGHATGAGVKTTGGGVKK